MSTEMAINNISEVEFMLLLEVFKNLSKWDRERKKTT